MTTARLDPDATAVRVPRPRSRAYLSGVSVTWYTWLEQGREIKQSRQVLDALTRTLRLSAAEHTYIRSPAGYSAPQPTPEQTSEAAPVHVQGLLDAPGVRTVDIHDGVIQLLATDRRAPDPSAADRAQPSGRVGTNTTNSARTAIPGGHHGAYRDCPISGVTGRSSWGR